MRVRWVVLLECNNYKKRHEYLQTMQGQLYAHVPLVKRYYAINSNLESDWMRQDLVAEQCAFTRPSFS